ncbi:MAG TPA: hypothetical protein VIH57_19095 [Bacteroidales bacterium]
MKSYIFVLAGVLALQSCPNNDDNSIENCTKGGNTFSKQTGTSLILSNQQWYLQRNGIGGGSIHVRLSGSTNGDSAKIACYGDGLLHYPPITLNASKEFDEDFEISFTGTAVKPGDITEHTIVTVYKGTDTLQVKLESCALRY